jgi:hypothetical protein
MKDFEVMSMAELVSYYNKNSSTPVGRFSSRNVGIRRCRAITWKAEAWEAQEAKTRAALDAQEAWEAQEAEKAEKAKKVSKVSKEELSVKMSAANRLAWKDPETAQKRSKRYGVIVDGNIFKSMFDAFTVLGLPEKKLGKLRLALIANGRQEWAGHSWELFEKITGVHTNNEEYLIGSGIIDAVYGLDE